MDTTRKPYPAFKKNQLSGCKRFVLRSILLLIYSLCLYAAAKKGTAVETIGTILFLTLALNMPAKQYRLMFSRQGVYEGESPIMRWITCKFISIVYEARGGGRDAYIVNLAE